MKQALIVAFILLLVRITTTAQSCLPEGIEFTTQASIDNFQVNYPNCTEIEGNVLIKGWDITNLNGLSAVNSIGGNLIIADNLNLTSLTGLDNITIIGQELWISNNCALTSLTGLLSLTSIGGDLTVQDHSTLTSLAGLNNLSFIGVSLYIYSNTSLNNLTGIENLTSIGMHLSIGNNPTLTSLTGLDDLSFIGGRLFIYNNATLNNLTGIGNLTSIGDEIYLMDNNALTSLSGLDNIDAESITNLRIYSNVSLSTCYVHSICDYLATPNGEISIHDNATGCNSEEEVVAACRIGVDENTTTECCFIIYLNPSSSFITIELQSAIALKNTYLSIYSISGQQVISRQVAEPTIVIDVGKLLQGIYFVKLTNDKTVQVGKFVKQ